NLIEILPVHRMKTSLNLRDLSPEQVTFQILTIRIINVCLEQTSLNLFDSVTIFKHSALEFGQRILPRNVPGNHRTDTVNESIKKLVPKWPVLVKRLHRILNCTLSSIGNSPLIVGTRVIPNSVKNRLIGRFLERSLISACHLNYLPFSQKVLRYAQRVPHLSQSLLSLTPPHHLMTSSNHN